MRVLVVAVVLAALAAPAAHAAEGDYCVSIARDGCTAADTVTDALATADRVRIFVGPGDFGAEEPLADADRPVEITGAGAGGEAPTILGELRLTSSGSRVASAVLSGPLAVAGRAEHV